jgi:hypothetical protein
MKKPNLLTRRSFLKSVTYGAGAAIGTRLVGSGRGWEGVAKADDEKPALFVIYLRGGYNALFSAAGGLKGSFGVDDGNIEDRGNGLVIDAQTYGTFADNVKSKMATIGVAHGLTDHDDSQMQKWWSGQDKSYVLTLADALGGDAAIKAAIVGDDNVPGSKTPVNGVTLQTVADMDATIAALGAAANDPRNPSRDITAAALDRAALMSKSAIDSNPQSLLSLNQGYPTASTLLRKPLKPFSFDKLNTDYQLNDSKSVDDWKSRVAAAELMITAGANVVIAVNDDWDSHGDTSGDEVRNHMNQEILPPLKTFFNNMWADTTRNVVVAVFGDFARSLPGSDHQPNCAVTVMGKYVKTGSTGNVDKDVNMKDGTPEIPQMWAYLNDVLKSPSKPFGANPHALVL